MKKIKSFLLGSSLLLLFLIMTATSLAEAQSDAAMKKIAHPLLSMNQAMLRGLTANQAFDRYAPHAMRQGKLQCIIGVDKMNDSVLQACKNAGLEIVGTHRLPPNLNNIVVRLTDPAQVFPVAELPEVQLILVEPRFATSAGLVRSQGVDAMNVDAATSTFNVNGTGVRVGVLSDSFFDTRNGSVAGGFLTGCDDQNTGDLPASIRMIDRGPNDGTTTDEGNAMAQLIYDVAPGCDIAFASAFTGYSQFASNITALHTDPTAPSHVIVDDVIYYQEPMYQDGPIAIAARNAGLAGIPYFSSAGNSADHAHQADYVDVDPINNNTDPTPTTKEDLHDFGQAKGLTSNTHLQVTLSNTTELLAVLHWNEPYHAVLGSGPGSEADLDLFIVDDPNWPDSGTVLGAPGVETQGELGAPFGNPVELAEYANTTGSEQSVYVVVNHRKGLKTDLLLSVILYFGGAGYVNDTNLIGDRTIYGHAAAEHVHAVAAHRYDVSTVEPFSSKGGALPFFFSDDGMTRYPVPQIRNKPEITAPDGTDTTFFGSGDFDGTGFPNFFGTSAAAPHAAAVATLLLEASPALETAAVYSILERTAVDIETPGFDDFSGFGKVDAFAALDELFQDIEDWRNF